MIRLLLILFGSIIILLPGCSKDKPSRKERIATYNDGGWSDLDKGNFANAYTDFLKAIALDSTDAEANLGAGWAQILKNDTALVIMKSHFMKATDNLEWQSDAWCGLAIVALAQGALAEADSLAGLVLQADPSYVFTPYPAIDWRDAVLIQAQARFLQMDYAGCWTALAEIMPGTVFDTIIPTDPSTWIIGTRTYNFEESIQLGLLAGLTDLYGR